MRIPLLAALAALILATNADAFGGRFRSRTVVRTRSFGPRVAVGGVYGGGVSAVRVRSFGGVGYGAAFGGSVGYGSAFGGVGYGAAFAAPPVTYFRESASFGYSAPLAVDPCPAAFGTFGGGCGTATFRQRTFFRGY